MPTVLVVEDADLVRDVFSKTLRQHGYQVIEAGSPEEAKRVCDGHIRNVDLLIVNVVLPGKSGPEFANELVAAAPRLKVLFASGMPLEHWAQRDFEAMAKLPAGSYSFFAKPFKSQQLVGKVQELIGKAEA